MTYCSYYSFCYEYIQVKLEKLAYCTKVIIFYNSLYETPKLKKKSQKIRI